MSCPNCSRKISTEPKTQIYRLEENDWDRLPFTMQQALRTNMVRAWRDEGKFYFEVPLLAEPELHHRLSQSAVA